MEGIAAVAPLIALLTYFEMNRLRKRLERQQAQWETLCREMGRTDLLERRFLRRFWSRSGSIRPRGKPRRPSAAFAGPVTWIWPRPRRTWTNFESAISHGEGQARFRACPFLRVGVMPGG